MKRPSPLLRRRGDADTDIDAAMTPMIDVVFLLLVFFVWTASFQIVEQVLDTEVAAQLGTESTEDVDPPPEKDFDDVVVKIGWDGQRASWSINNQPMNSLQAVSQQLNTIARIQNEAPVILDPQPEVPLGQVIDVYDVTLISGFEEISFAVNPRDL
jgi:biopolymer transport protein ExbD